VYITPVSLQIEALIQTVVSLTSSILTHICAHVPGFSVNGAVLYLNQRKHTHRGFQRRSTWRLENPIQKSRSFHYESCGL